MQTSRIITVLLTGGKRNRIEEKETDKKVVSLPCTSISRCQILSFNPQKFGITSSVEKNLYAITVILGLH